MLKQRVEDVESSNKGENHYQKYVDASIGQGQNNADPNDNYRKYVRNMM